VALLGCLYVLGGSHKRRGDPGPLDRQFPSPSPPGKDCPTFHVIAAKVRQNGKAFASLIDAFVTDLNQVQAMVETALVIFQCLLEAFEALCPMDRADMRHVVTALNPEAGNHPMPQDDRDLIAVAPCF